MTLSPPHATPRTTEEFRENLAMVRRQIDDAARRAGRDPEDVTLLAVSKTFPEERLEAALAAGASYLGENKLHELERKANHCADAARNGAARNGAARPRWAVIGHVQRNKAKIVARVADELHSLDSLRLATELEKRLATEDRALDVFLQVNTSGEEQKFGLAPDEVPEVAAALSDYPHLTPRGFMTMAVHSDDEAAVRACFARLRALRDRLSPDYPQLRELSMGMSGDFPLAIAEGATIVRIGQAIFGARDYPTGNH